VTDSKGIWPVKIAHQQSLGFFFGDLLKVKKVMSPVKNVHQVVCRRFLGGISEPLANKVKLENGC